MKLQAVLQKHQGEEIFLTLDADQLSIFGQTFRPIFVGTVTEVTDGHVTLNPVTVKMINAPQYEFPTPLSFPLDRIISFTPFNSDTVFPLT